MLVRSAFAYLPMAFILAGVAIAGAALLVAITDDMSSAVVASLGTKQSDNLLQAVGDAYRSALDEGSGIPLFGVFLGAIILALGAFVLWLEMIIRDAAIYICVFFLPLTFVAMVWPATGRWARRLVELLVAVILAKFVIVSILVLATAAIANTGVVEGEGNTFEQMLAGSALLILAAWSPFALLRMIPAMEVAAANVASQRSTMQSAAGSAGVHSPAVYMRQAMDRHSRASAFGDSEGRPATTSVGPHAGASAAPGGMETAIGQWASDSHEEGSVLSRPPTAASPKARTGDDGGRTEPGRPPSQPRPSPRVTPRPRPTEPPPPPHAQRPRPPEPPPDRRPPTDRGDV
jgi:hypothetical protein